MSGSSVTAFDALSPVPEISVLELAVVIVFARRPGIDVIEVAAEISRWFKVELRASDLVQSVRQLQNKAWLVADGAKLRATEKARERAEFATRGIVHLAFRDHYFFDVSKLLDVTLVKEDLRRDH